MVNDPRPESIGGDGDDERSQSPSGPLGIGAQYRVDFAVVVSSRWPSSAASSRNAGLNHVPRPI